MKGQELTSVNAAKIDQLVEAFTSEMDIKATTRATYGGAIKAFFGWLEAAQGKGVTEVTAADIVAYKGYMVEHFSASTAATAIAAIRSLFMWVERHGGRNIAASIKPPKIVRKFQRQHLTPVQARALIEAARNLRDKAIATLLLTSGLREAELCGLNVGDIQSKTISTEKGDITRRVAYIKGKGHDYKDDFVLVSPLAWKAIKAYLCTRKDATLAAPLFVARGGARLSARSVRYIIHNLLELIGCEGAEYSTHSLRHTAAVAALKGGVALDDVQHMLRHASPATTQIYLKSIEEERRLTQAPELEVEKFLL